MNENLCGASEMTVAIDGYSRLVDIRAPGAIDTWRGRKGLECLVCRRGVEPFRSSRGNLFLRHTKTEHGGEFHPTTTGYETYQHKHLKYWVRDRLRAHGVVDAEVEPRVGHQIPDVYGTRDGKGYAVEIQWSDLDYEAARQRTDGLRDAGCENILWLTRHCDWVEQLPALGLRDFDPQQRDYRAHTGYLAIGTGDRLYVETCSIRWFLGQWTTDALAWAYRNRTTAGWATVTDWQAYTRQQDDKIRQQAHQLAAAAEEKERLERDLDAAQQATNEMQSARDQAHEAQQLALKTIRSLDVQVAAQESDVKFFKIAVGVLLLVCIALGFALWLT
ncbi:hypothetical protein [Nocardia otitidiscaviarum]|uniref:competence protein CoiA family protein n=1 Tax=Nocardia otitidiscaviarum TaxID=1823 RepID=UPI0024561B5E|nr:hypothetical protein [Nocardia otitidiscaviarum]